jgi:glycosyltransferase involved in cell wall biosynthesis
MKVMINLLSSGSGGALSYIRNLIPLLAQEFAATKEHQLVLLLHHAQRQELPELASEVEYVAVEKQKNGYIRVLWEMYALSRIVKEKNIDVLFTPYQLTPAVKHVKTVVMIRNMEPFLFEKYRYDFKNYIRNVILRRSSIKTLKGANRVIAVSQYAASYCLQTLKIPNENLTTIYHGRDKRFSPKVDSNDKSVIKSLGITGDYIFTCGSMLPYRRCELIIEAFSRWAIDKECELVIAGASNDHGYQTLIKQLIGRSPVADKIKWLGQVKVDAMRVLYRHCKLFITTTEIEACPNIAIEALSSGCYIVSSDNEPLPEIFAEAAAYCQAGNEQELAAQIDRNFSDQARVNDTSLARAENFSWESCSQNTFKVLTDWNLR